MLSDKAVLPEGFTFETLSNEQLVMFTSPEYLALETDAARAAALTEVDKSGPAGEGENGQGASPQEPAGNVRALRNPSTRSIHERHTDTYWEPKEVRSLADVTLKEVRPEKIARALAAKTLEEATMNTKMAFGVVEAAPAPTIQAPVVPANPPGEGAKDGANGSDGDTSEPPKRGLELPEGFTYEKLNMAQLAIVDDEKFVSLSSDEKKKLLAMAASPEDVLEEQATPGFVAQAAPQAPAPSPAAQADADF